VDLLMPTDPLAPWHEFYSTLGEAAATMIGLLFVAASVGAGVFSPDRRAALRVFLSASVVHLSGVLAICLIILAPFPHNGLFGAMVMACGVFGLGYYVVVGIDVVRDGLLQRIDLEDRIWYAVLPALSYMVEVGAGLALYQGMPIGIWILAFTVGALIMIAIHNAWDITVWSMTRRGQ
jgi:hypothetical protein